MTPDAKSDRLHERTLEAERAVLGGILVDAVQLDAAREVISGQDFARLAHRHVWDTIVKLADDQHPVDLVTVQQALPADELETVGIPYLAGLIDGVPQAMNVGYYASLVRERSTLRSLSHLGHRIHTIASTADENAAALLEDAEQALFALRQRATTTTVQAPAARASATYKQLETLQTAKGSLRGTPTGLKDLDADLRGLHPGNLIVLGARPSMGKTAIALTFAINGAHISGRPGLFFSLEMSTEELNLREVTMRANVNSWRISHGWTSESEQYRLNQALEAMADGGVSVVDAPLLTVGQIRAISRRAHGRVGLSLIVIDYLQLMHAERRRKGERSAENRTLELSEMTRGLKGLARDLKVPVVLLSQLSRAVESRSDKRPQLSDLRESGSIEQDADVVLLLCRPPFYPEFREKYPPHYAELQIAKQRNGPTGMVKLSFFRDETRFAEFTELVG